MLRLQPEPVENVQDFLCSVLLKFRQIIRAFTVSLLHRGKVPADDADVEAVRRRGRSWGIKCLFFQRRWGKTKVFGCLRTEESFVYRVAFTPILIAHRTEVPLNSESEKRDQRECCYVVVVLIHQRSEYQELNLNESGTEPRCEGPGPSVSDLIAMNRISKKTGTPAECLAVLPLSMWWLSTSRSLLFPW